MRVKRQMAHQQVISPLSHKQRVLSSPWFPLSLKAIIIIKHKLLRGSIMWSCIIMESYMGFRPFLKFSSGRKEEESCDCSAEFVPMLNALRNFQHLFKILKYTKCRQKKWIYMVKYGCIEGKCLPILIIFPKRSIMGDSAIWLWSSEIYIWRG